MNIIEALEAALADGMFYCSNDISCDMPIENEMVRRRARDDEARYSYRDGVIFRLSPLDGIEDEVFLCQSADEVHAEREREEDDE